MASTASDVLALNPVFAAASPEARARLIRGSRQRTVAAGDPILVEGQEAESVYALEEGAVRVFHLSPKGEEVVIKLFRAPAIFGEAEALGGVPHQEHVSAVSDARLLVMPLGAIMTLLRAEPECALRLLVDVAARLAIAAYNEKSLAFHPITIRLANYLLDYAAWTNPPGALELKIALTQDEMAAAVGGTRRSIAKDMIAWQEEGILERRGRHYLLREIEALRRYSDGDRLELTYELLEQRMKRLG
jgi:CRP/FNR family transcriptional regulator